MSGGGKEKKPRDSAQTRALAAVAAEKWNFAQSKLRPLQQLYMEQVGQINTDQNKQYVRGRANDGMQDALGDASSAIAKQAHTRGLSLDSGAVSGANTDAAIAAASAGGDTANRGELELGNQEVMGMQNILNMGSGQETRALAGMTRMSRAASDDARSSAINTFNRRSANLQTLGTIAGAGTRAAMKGWETPEPTANMATSEGNPTGWAYDDYGTANPNLGLSMS